jgi:hypothetical protein
MQAKSIKVIFKCRSRTVRKYNVKNVTRTAQDNLAINGGSHMTAAT